MGVLIVVISIIAAMNMIESACGKKKALSITVMMYWLLVWLYWIMKMGEVA